MSKTFNYWNKFFEAMGRPLQSCAGGSAGRSDSDWSNTSAVQLPVKSAEYPAQQVRTLQQIACTEAARELDERSARICPHCRKDIPADSLYHYWRGSLLHQDCRMPFIVANHELVTAREMESSR